VSKEALKEAEENVEKVRAFKKKADSELELAEKEFNRARSVWDLQSELEDLSREEKELLAKQPLADQKRRLHQQAQKAEELGPAIKKHGSLKEKLKKTLAGLQAASERLGLLEDELHETARLYNALKEQAKDQRPRLLEKSSRLKDARVLEADISDIDTRLVELRKQYDQLSQKSKQKDEEIKNSKLQLESTDKSVRETRNKINSLKVDPEYRRDIQKGVKLEEYIERLGEEIKGHRAGLEEASDRMKTLEKRLGDTDTGRRGILDRLSGLKDRQAKLESQRPGSREEIMQDVHRVHDLQLKCQALGVQAAGIEELTEKHENFKRMIKRQQQELEDRQVEMKTLSQQLTECRQTVEDMEGQQRQNTAFILAESLEENRACPVCGSTHHPRPATRPDSAGKADFEGRFKDAREGLQQAEQLYRNTENKCLIIKEQLKNSKAQRLQASEELAEASSRYKELVSRLPAPLQELDIKKLERELEGMASDNKKRLAAFEEWERDTARINDEIQNLSRQHSEMSVEYNSRKAELALNGGNLERLQKAFKDASRMFETKNKEYREFLSRFGIDDARGELELMEEKDRQASRLQDELEKLQQKDNKLRGIREALHADKHRLDSRLSVIETEGKGLKEQRKSRKDRIRELTEGRGIKAALEAVQREIRELEARENRLQQRVKELETEYNKTDRLKNTLENQKTIYKKDLDDQIRSLQDSLKEKGFSGIDEAEDALLSEEECRALNEWIQRYDKGLADVRVRRDMCVKKLEGRSLTRQQWDTMNRLYKDKKQQKEDAISSYEQARLNCSRLKDNYGRWTKLDKQYRRHQRKAEMLEQIQRLLRGNSFVEFISEERIRYIAREASETLGVLTKYRYALELDTGQGFVIRDYANGGVLRAVSTLSGGETFLASLSLALALSKQIQLKGQSPLEFFFLDEGFGTLDSGLLDVVIDALERLSSKQRVIGVISHVPELKHRIARRLIVEPPTVYGEGSRVSLEK
jgi:exonuclease SbcC